MATDTSNCTKKYLELAWLDETTHCYNFDGVTQSAKNTPFSSTQFYDANHLTQFIFVDKQPDGSTSGKFYAIWVVIIVYNILLGILLFCSFIACLVKNKSDYDIRNKYNAGEDDEEFEDIGKIDAVDINRVQNND